MSLSYKSLENEYHKTLRELASSFVATGKSMSEKKLPYFLEHKTKVNLKPAKNWFISAISGTGKTTVAAILSKSGFQKIRNVTTRQRRKDETERDYIFTNKNTFLRWKKSGLLFNPHKRNNVLHAVLKNDLKKLIRNNKLTYLDKSVESSIFIKNHLPQKVNFSYIFLLAPTFRELHSRIKKREKKREREKSYLSKKDIFNRFEEEIKDMKKSIKLPYVYIVNDSLKRIEKLLKKVIKVSKQNEKATGEA